LLLSKLLCIGPALEVLCSKPKLLDIDLEEALKPDCRIKLKGVALESRTSSLQTMVVELVDEVRISPAGFGDVDRHTCNRRTQHRPA
jgi:hypothetical protein